MQQQNYLLIHQSGQITNPAAVVLTDSGTRKVFYLLLWITVKCRQLKTLPLMYLPHPSWHLAVVNPLLQPPAALHYPPSFLAAVNSPPHHPVAVCHPPQQLTAVNPFCRLLAVVNPFSLHLETVCHPPHTLVAVNSLPRPSAAVHSLSQLSASVKSWAPVAVYSLHQPLPSLCPLQPWAALGLGVLLSSSPGSSLMSPSVTPSPGSSFSSSSVIPTSNDSSELIVIFKYLVQYVSTRKKPPKAHKECLVLRADQLMVSIPSRRKDREKESRC